MPPKKQNEEDGGWYFGTLDARRITTDNITTTGDVVDGRVPLAPLVAIGSFDLAGSVWPVWGASLPLFVQETRSLFSSEEEFRSRAFPLGFPPFRSLEGEQATSRGYQPHIDYLEEHGVLQHRPQLSARGFCSYFAVAKDTENFRAVTARAVFDLRKVNQASAEEKSFSLFSVAQLLESFVRIGPQVHFVQADLSNCYYQLKIPAFMGELMALFMSVQNEDAEEATLRVSVPMVMPMGWQTACRVAQSITVGGVGASPSDATIEEKLGMPPHIQAELDPPAIWELQFKDHRKGAAAVIYDTIIVVVNDADLAEKWRVRIEKNFKQLNLSLKYLKLGREALFDGIDWSQGRFGIQWRVAQGTFDCWKKMSETLRDTPRALWRALGYIRRWADIHMVERHCFATFAKVQASIAQANAREFADMSAIWWDTPQQQIDEILVDLRSYIKALQNPWASISLFRQKQKRNRENTVFIVVDSTLQWMSVVRLSSEGSLLEWPTARTVPEGTGIEGAEAKAMRWGLDLPAAKDADRCVLGGDNTGVSRSFWKGYSLADSIDRHIPNRPAQSWIIVDISTDDNLADVKTRPTEIWLPEDVEKRRWKSAERLRRALSAFESWPAVSYFGREHSIFSSVEEDFNARTIAETKNSNSL